MHFVFVYGTLKQGCKNYLHMRGQTLVGPARTAPGYRLHDLGDYPGLVEAPDDTAGVIGEIWEVDAHALKRLDAFEGVDEGLYARLPVRLLPPHAEKSVDVYVYLRSVAGLPALGPEWTER